MVQSLLLISVDAIQCCYKNPLYRPLKMSHGCVNPVVFIKFLIVTLCPGHMYLESARSRYVHLNAGSVYIAWYGSDTGR